MKNVLKRKQDFDYVFKNGLKASSSTLTILYVKQKSQKAGFCVGKKHGKAVLRNRIKRLLRAAFGLFKGKIGNYYIVFLPKIREKYDFNDFKKDMEYIFLKEKLYDEKNSCSAD